MDCNCQGVIQGMEREDAVERKVKHTLSFSYGIPVHHSLPWMSWWTGTADRYSNEPVGPCDIRAAWCRSASGQPIPCIGS